MTQTRVGRAFTIYDVVQETGTIDSKKGKLTLFVYSMLLDDIFSIVACVDRVRCDKILSVNKKILRLKLNVS